MNRKFMSRNSGMIKLSLFLFLFLLLVSYSLYAAPVDQKKKKSSLASHSYSLKKIKANRAQFTDSAASLKVLSKDEKRKRIDQKPPEPQRVHAEGTTVAVTPSVQSEKDPAPTCGEIIGLMGDVQILDASRSHLLNLGVNDSIPCGAWISSHLGWMAVRHQLGPYFHLGQETYVQFLEASSDVGEHLIVYKGDVYAHVQGAQPEIRILSATSRVRIQEAQVIFLAGYSPDRAQLMVLKDSATLENRFESTKGIQVRQGEVSELVLQNDRVLPQAPSPVAWSSLEPQLLELRVPRSVQKHAQQIVMSRQSQKPSIQSQEVLDAAQQVESPLKGRDRKLASQNTPHSYEKFPPSSHDQYLKKYFVESVIGGEKMGRKILFPDEMDGSLQGVRIQVEDLTPGLSLLSSPLEKKEKKWLMEQLARIKTNE